MTRCPFCVLNYEDTAKSMNKEGSVATMDIAEVLANSP